MGLLHSATRLSALLWTLLVTALIGNVIANNVNGASSATKALNYTMFVAAWSWVAGLYGLAASVFSALAISFVLLPLDILAALFTFIDAILLSAKIGTPDCSDIAPYGRSWIAFGSHNDEKRCREIQASTVFMWFLWVSFMGCLFFSFKEASGGLGGISSPFKRRSKVGAPNMSQV
jgi:hypothetical protein